MVNSFHASSIPPKWEYWLSVVSIYYVIGMIGEIFYSITPFYNQFFIILVCFCVPFMARKCNYGYRLVETAQSIFGEKKV